MAIHHCYVCHLDVEVLIHRMKSSANTQIVLQFNDHILAYQALEEREEQHLEHWSALIATDESVNQYVGQYILVVISY